MKLPALNKCILPVILLVGFALRIWGLDFGLPGLLHQDEPIVVNHALAYGTGDLNPHFFAIPPLTSYLLFIVYGFLFMFGRVFGLWASTQSFAIQFFEDPTLFYIVGRVFIGVIPGMLCILVTYFLSKKVISERASLFAAAIMAFSFLNVTNSHYIYTDMLLTLFVVLSFCSFFVMQDKPSFKNYCLAGLMVGIATGAKYNGALLGLSFIAAHISGIQTRGAGVREYMFSGKLWGGIFVSTLVFCLTTPFIILDFPGFYGSVKIQGGAFWRTGWGHHFFYSISEGISFPIAVAGLAGLILISLRKVKGAVLLSFPLVYYLLIVQKSQHFARYALPIIPFLAIGAGYLLLDIVYPKAASRVVKAITIILSILLLIPTFVKSVKADMLFSATDTRINAATWIEKNLPAGVKIACDSTNFRPVLTQPYSQLLEKNEYLDVQQGLAGLKARKLDLQMQALKDEDAPGYPVYFLFEYPEDAGQFLNTAPALPFDLKVLNEHDVRYVSINSQLNFEAKRNFLEVLEKEAELVAVFSPYYDGEYSGTADGVATTCISVKSEELYSRRSTGPALKLYRLR